MKSEAGKQKVKVSRSPRLLKIWLSLILVLLLAIFGLFISNSINDLSDNEKQADKNTVDQNSQTTASAKLYFSPNSSTLTKNTPADIELWVDSGDTVINAVQAIFSYPVELLEVVSIDYASSAFDIQAESNFENGMVRIGRGQVEAKSGKQLIARLRITPKQGSGTALFQFTEEQLAYRASDNANILQDTEVASFTLQEGN